MLEELDDLRKKLIKQLLQFLVYCDSHSEVTMMTAANLGIVFSPNIFQSRPEADVFRQFEVI